MAIINVELRMMIAERLANDNYREEIKEVKESLRLHLLAYLKENYIPKEVQTVFEKHPQFFKAVDAIYIASYNFKKLSARPRAGGRKNSYGGTFGEHISKS